MLLALLAAGLLGGGLTLAAILLVRPILVSDPVNVALIRDTLRANPELVLDALQILQDRRAATVQAQQTAAIAENREALVASPGDFVGGNPQGDVTVVEFFDYRCPYCRQALETVRELIKDDPQIRLVYKEYPILGPQSLIAAKIAVAARLDGRYEARHDALMQAPSPLSEDQALGIAGSLGFDRAALAEAMQAPEVERILQANHALARALGINGTPAFIIGQTLVPGVASLSDLKRLVTGLRAQRR